MYPYKFIDLGSSATTQRNIALDIGCGTGQLCLSLSKSYDKVFGIDVSESQLEIARNKIWDQDEYNNIQYSYANSHDLDEFWELEMDKQKIDLVTFGQSLQWVDYDLLFKNYQKYMAEGVAMAIFSYGFCKIVDADVLEEIKLAVEEGVVFGTEGELGIKFDNIESHGVEIDKEYTGQGTKANELFQNFYTVVKPHFEWNCDDMINHFSHINFNDYFTDVKRYLYYDVKKGMKISDYIQFVRTLSGYRWYLEKFPDEIDPLKVLIQSLWEIYQAANETELETKTFDIAYPYFLATLKY